MLHLLIWNLVSVKKSVHIMNDGGSFPKFNKCLTDKWDHVMSLPSYYSHGILIRWRSLCLQHSWFIINKVQFETACLTLLFFRTAETFSKRFVFPVGSMEVEIYFSFIRPIHKRVCNSIVTDLIGELTVNAIMLKQFLN